MDDDHAKLNYYSNFSDEDMAIKLAEDAFRDLCIRGDPSAASVGKALLCPTGSLLGVKRELSPYPKEAHVFGLHPAGDKYYLRPASVPTLEALAACIPVHLRGLKKVPGIAVCGGFALELLQNLEDEDKDESETEDGENEEDEEEDGSERKKDVTDVDVFLFGDGLESDTAFMARVLQVLVAATEPYGIDDDGWVLSRSVNGITLACNATINKFGYHVPPLVLQVILRRNPYGVAQVLSGFDLDASAVAWVPSDTEQPFVALPRFLRALGWGSNLGDLDRQSETFEARLVKYATAKRKGFDIILPGVNVPAVSFARMLRGAAGQATTVSPRGGLTALLFLALLACRKQQQPDGDNYAGAIHSLDLYGELSTFHHRAKNAACNSKTPIVFMAPRMKNMQPLATKKQKRGGVVACRMAATLEALCASKKVIQEIRAEEIAYEMAAPPRVPLPMEIADGMCASFRPRLPPVDGRSPEIEWLAA